MAVYESGYVGTTVTVSFRQATIRGAAANLRPGHCTWLDRTLNSREPTNFTISSRGAFSFYMTGSGRITRAAHHRLRRRILT